MMIISPPVSHVRCARATRNADPNFCLVLGHLLWIRTSTYGVTPRAGCGVRGWWAVPGATGCTGCSWEGYPRVLLVWHVLVWHVEHIRHSYLI